MLDAETGKARWVTDVPWSNGPPMGRGQRWSPRVDVGGLGPGSMPRAGDLNGTADSIGMSWQARRMPSGER